MRCLFQFFSVFLILLVNFSHIDSFSKFGRNCNDIGCIPGQTCVIIQDICQRGQVKGKECGSYPTCKRIGGPKQPVIQASRFKPIASTNVRNSPKNNVTPWYNNPIIKQNNPQTTIVSGSRPAGTAGKTTKKPGFLKRWFGG